MNKYQKIYEELNKKIPNKLEKNICKRRLELLDILRRVLGTNYSSKSYIHIACREEGKNRNYFHCLYYKLKLKAIQVFLD